MFSSFTQALSPCSGHGAVHPNGWLFLERIVAFAGANKAMIEWLLQPRRRCAALKKVLSAMNEVALAPAPSPQAPPLGDAKAAVNPGEGKKVKGEAKMRKAMENSGPTTGEAQRRRGDTEKEEEKREQKEEKNGEEKKPEKEEKKGRESFGEEGGGGEVQGTR